MAEDIPGNPDNIKPYGREDMTNQDLPGNSYSDRKKKTETADEPRKVNKVVKGEVIQKRKGVGHKVAETFVGDDVRSVGSYILFDVVIPAAKNMLADAASQGVERMLFGDSRSRSRVSGRTGTNPSYGSMYRPRESRNGRREMSERSRATHDFDEIILEERGEAEEVLDQLTLLVEDYGHAKVSDLYDLVGITGNYTDDKWGWFDLRAASTSRVRQGYLLDMPKPVVLD